MFYYWKAYLTKRAVEHDSKDYALARLSAIVYNSLKGEGVATVDEVDMLIKFETALEAETNREREKELQEQKDLSFFNSLEAKYGTHDGKS